MIKLPFGKHSKSRKNPTKKRVEQFEKNVTKAWKTKRTGSEEEYLETLQTHFEKKNSPEQKPPESPEPESVTTVEPPEPQQPSTSEQTSMIPPSPEPDLSSSPAQGISPAASQHNAIKADTFEPGDIFYLEDKSLVIFKKEVPAKEYDFVLELKKNGKIEPKGICLYAYERMKIGHLPEQQLEAMALSLTWKRDLIVYHLSDYGFSQLIPRPTSDKHMLKDQQAVPHRSDNNKPVRGERFTISIGEKKWDGVYWGKDVLGTVVTHNTNGTWMLMHLDLSRFEDTLEYGVILSQKEIEEIEAQITQNAPQPTTS